MSSREVFLLCCCTRVCVYGTCLLHCQTASSGCDVARGCSSHRARRSTDTPRLWDEWFTVLLACRPNSRCTKWSLCGNQCCGGCTSRAHHLPLSIGV